mgnify:CR=1 FL=1
MIWPRGSRWLELQLPLVCPPDWRRQQRGDRLARLVLRWWADAVELRVDGVLVHQGDLFDTACRWPLPEAWWQGQPLQLQLRLRSPLHDDGALITSQLEQEPCDPADPTGVLTAPQLALANNEPQRALALTENFMEQNPLSAMRADALLIKGDAELAMDSEWQALFAYEEIARKYATTAVFVPALEREFEVARAYCHGLRKKFFGTFRILDAGDDGQEILIRIQERLPGSELAEKAGMELADYYFRIRDMPLAADAYDLFSQNYPRSRQVVKARLRLIYSYYAQFKGKNWEQFDSGS